MSRFRLHYFLAEDAVEVISVDKRSDDAAPKLLGKRKLLLPQYQHSVKTCVEIKFYGAFALNLRVDLHAIDATPARWRGDAGSLPLDGASTAASSPSAPDALVDFHTARDVDEDLY